MPIRGSWFIGKVSVKYRSRKNNENHITNKIIYLRYS